MLIKGIIELLFGIVSAIRSQKSDREMLVRWMRATRWFSLSQELIVCVSYMSHDTLSLHTWQDRYNFMSSYGVIGHALDALSTNSLSPSLLNTHTSARALSMYVYVSHHDFMC